MWITTVTTTIRCQWTKPAVSKMEPIVSSELRALIKRAQKNDRRIRSFLRREKAQLIDLIGSHYIDRKLLMLLVAEAGLTNEHGGRLKAETAADSWKDVLDEPPGSTRDARYRGRPSQRRTAQCQNKTSPENGAPQADLSDTRKRFPPGIAIDGRAETIDRSCDVTEPDDVSQGMRKLRELRSERHDTTRPLPQVLRRRRM